MKRLLLFFACLNIYAGSHAAEWQWSTRVEGFCSPETGESPEAYLWIPPLCERVRAVVVGQHNMSEEMLFENLHFRERMAELDFAILWITPILDMPWDETTGCRQVFDRMLAALAAESGYVEIATAPIVPVGHSALATFPWNFAAWNPDRTLSVISLHGDAPRTNLTGYGRANLEWGRTRNIDGIPALMIEGEYEWWEARIQPALAFRMMYPESCVSFLGDAGRGHFDVADRTADYIALFLRKAAEQRLGTPLRKVRPDQGWLAARWHPDEKRRPKAAPVAQYKGDPHEAFWYFDHEMATLTEQIYAESQRRKPLYIGFQQSGAAVPYDENFHARIRGRFQPQADGVTFCLSAFFSDSTRQQRVAAHPIAEPKISRICGPVKQINDTTFRICFDRSTAQNPRRGASLWLVAEHSGNATYKSAVQQILIDIPHRNSAGQAQHLTFPPLSDVALGEPLPPLRATSDCALPVSYYVRSGPACVVDGVLQLLPIPPRSRFPIRITVVAWQYGIAQQTATAEPVERHFFITQNP